MRKELFRQRELCAAGVVGVLGLGAILEGRTYGIGTSQTWGQASCQWPSAPS